MTKQTHSMAPPPTPHTHNYNTIQNFVVIKIGLNQYQAINQVFVWSHNAAPLLRPNPQPLQLAN